MNTTRPLAEVRPLSSSGRSTLSADPTTTAQIRLSTMARATSPARNSQIATGTHTIVAPITGSSEQMAMATPHTAGAGRSRAQKRRRR